MVTDKAPGQGHQHPYGPEPWGVWTGFAKKPLCSLLLQHESEVLLTLRIAPFLRQLYGDGTTENLALLAARQHFRVHETRDIVT
jgi:hypothetical protein